MSDRAVQAEVEFGQATYLVVAERRRYTLYLLDSLGVEEGGEGPDLDELVEAAGGSPEVVDRLLSALSAARYASSDRVVYPGGVDDAALWG